MTSATASLVAIPDPSRSRRTFLAMFASGLLFALPSGPALAKDAFELELDSTNIARSFERQATYLTPGFQAALASDMVQDEIQRLMLRLTDPERQPDPNSCSVPLICEGDVRLDHWKERGYGLVQPVLFTARS